ncbi:hypothetical protein [Streptomyces sp. SLBN-134]|uniref:hypothetical protein n=1 Tax=Streptomyces sp. SLBN-134 TaxID=2768456 RepID=UPI0011538C7A|nr:hypothetical protein [Streptomyces sp. SLBN-134]TQL20490.1 hypothetical protein FBY37_2446 [Streptomyces sp. SLBN-134]
MADGDDDFYSRDRPENPYLEEDRPRGGGPDDPGGRGNWPVWVIILAVILLFVIITVLLG